MRSAELLLAGALLFAAAAPACAQPPSREEVRQAIEAVRKHPDLGGTRKQKVLRFREDEPAAAAAPNWLARPFAWLRDLMVWLAEAGRVLVWLLGALLVALLLVGMWRWMQVRGGMGRAERAHLPSHVQSLDIRPESLPAAVGDAAAQLWQRGEHRAALSLLYRGALSRLVHGHGVPIRAASTEGECLALAGTRIDAQRSAFFARLVQAWQLAVYGARLPDAQQALALCREFDTVLPAPIP